MEQNTSPAAAPAGGPSQDARAKAQALLAQLTGKMQKNLLVQGIEFRISVLERQIAGCLDVMKHAIEHRDPTGDHDDELEDLRARLDIELNMHTEATKMVADPSSPA